MKAVRFQLRCAPGQLAREEDVAQLGGPVHAHRRIGLLRLQVLEIQRARFVGVGRGRHDPPTSQVLAQQVGEQERRQVVERERPLEALRGDLARGEQRACVVGEDVDVLVAALDLLGQGAHLGHQRQIGDVLVDGSAAAERLRLLRDRLHTLGLASDERELHPLARELQRGGAPDPACSSGEHDERHGPDSTATTSVVL